MVKQGDIILIDFAPNIGHEQTGKRPALVLSCNTYNNNTKMIILCPITSNSKPFPTHVELDSDTKTSGVVMCEQIRSMDLSSRQYRILEHASDNLLLKVLNTVNAILEYGG